MRDVSTIKRGLAVCAAVAAAFCAAPAARAATPFDGLWQGKIVYQPAEVEFEIWVELAPDAEGELVGTIDMPAARMRYELLEQVTAEGEKISFGFRHESEVRGPGALFRFDGALAEDGTIRGEFVRDGGNKPFYLERIGEPGSPRPEWDGGTPLRVLSEDGEALRALFNRDADRVRLVLLLSPS